MTVIEGEKLKYVFFFFFNKRNVNKYRVCYGKKKINKKN